MADDTKSISQYQASKIDEYYKIYKTYLMDHGLSDDANSITIESLVNFVENHILSEHTPNPKSCRIVIDKIDLHLLRQQKQDLIKISDKLDLVEPELSGTVDGMICLIDAIQDYAADTLGIDEKEIYNLTDDGENN